MKKLQNTAALLFIACVGLLTIVSILGVWNVFATDVIWKSFQTIGLLAAVSVIVIFAGRFMDMKHAGEVAQIEEIPNPIFEVVRRLTVVFLVTAIAVLALLGILSIWEVVGGDVISKSFSSIVIATFSSLIIVVTCLEREKDKMLKNHTEISGGAVLLFFLGIWWMYTLIF